MNNPDLDYLRERWHFTYRSAKAAFIAYASVRPHDQELFQLAMQAAGEHSDARVDLVNYLETNGPQTPT